jgi:hypothetical protein
MGINLTDAEEKQVTLKKDNQCISFRLTGILKIFNSQFSIFKTCHKMSQVIHLYERMFRYMTSRNEFHFLT